MSIIKKKHTTTFVTNHLVFLTVNMTIASINLTQS